MAQRSPLMIERDYSEGEGQTCCFCEQRFISGHTLWKRTWEHLDNNDENEALWNLAWAHWKCNQDKIDDFDLQFQARDIIKKNQQWEKENNVLLESEKKNSFESARAREKTQPANEDTEIDLNVAHHEIAENFLTEKIIDKNPRTQLSDSIHCITLRCRKQTGHGSAQAIRNYLNVLSCSEGIYKIEKIEGKNYIVRRSKS